MSTEKLFEARLASIGEVTLNDYYIEPMKELIETLSPYWQGKALTHYFYRAPSPLHVLSSDELEITINVGFTLNIPTGFDLQDSLRVQHITVDLQDSIDLNAFIEYLRLKLGFSLDVDIF